MSDDESDLVEVRAIGVYARGLLHLVRRPPNQVLDYLPALCGLNAQRGWVTHPAYSDRRCEACDRKASRPPTPGL